MRTADLDPRQALRDGYDRIAARYAHWIADGPVDTAAVEHLQHLVERLPPGARVLDLGCGGGDRWRHLAEIGHWPVQSDPGSDGHLTSGISLTGVDLSFQQLVRARQVVPRARLIQADMTRLALRPAAFHAIVSLYAFNHLPFGELPSVLTNIARWLKPGGLLLANMATSHNPGTVDPDWLGVPMYFSGYAVDQSQAFVRAAGLEIQSVHEETVLETMDGRTTPARFLWISAQRPVS